MPASTRESLVAGVCETAAALLGLADEAGLTHLRAVALDFAVMHFDAVAKTAAWAGLPRSCADAVAAEVSCAGCVLCHRWCLVKKPQRHSCAGDMPPDRSRWRKGCCWLC